MLCRLRGCSLRLARAASAGERPRADPGAGERAATRETWTHYPLVWDASALAEGLRDGEVLSSPPTAHGGKTSELGRWSGMLSFPKYFRTKPPAILHFRFLFHFMALAGVLPRASSTLTAYNNTFSLLLDIFSLLSPSHLQRRTPNSLRWHHIFPPRWVPLVIRRPHFPDCILRKSSLSTLKQKLSGSNHGSDLTYWHTWPSNLQPSLSTKTCLGHVLSYTKHTTLMLHTISISIQHLLITISLQEVVNIINITWYQIVLPTWIHHTHRRWTKSRNHQKIPFRTHSVM